MQSALHQTNEWGNRHTLEFSPTKSGFILFGLMKSIPKLTLKLAGKTLNQWSETKYLGLTIDQRLTWSSHLTNKIKSTTRALMLINNAIG